MQEFCILFLTETREEALSYIRSIGMYSLSEYTDGAQQCCTLDPLAQILHCLISFLNPNFSLIWSILSSYENSFHVCRMTACFH